MNVKTAWEIAARLFEADYIEDIAASLRAGYRVYRSTNPYYKGWINDLGSRLELNMPSGRTINLWIK